MTLGTSQVILLTVSEFAKICQTTIRTIHFYEKEKLIKPAKIDQENSYRYYYPQQARKVAQIKLLQHFDLPLKEIKMLIDSKQAQSSMQIQLDKIEKEISKKQKELQVLGQLNEVLFEYKKTDKYLKDEYIGPFSLFSLTIKNGDYHKINDYIDQLKETAKELNLNFLSSEITFFLSDKYEPKNTTLEVALICEQVEKKVFLLNKGYSIRKFPKTKCVTFNFQGPYHYLTAIYNGLDRYVIDNNILIIGPVFEYYVINPVNANSPYEYITKICYPI